MISRSGQVQTSPRGSFSFPYGAAALTRQLNEIESKHDSKAKETLSSEMRTSFRNAFDQLEIPNSLLDSAKAQGGFVLYLSGGGFRGWGYLLMSQSHIQPYPIPIINGYQVPISQFRNIQHLQTVAANSLTSSNDADSSDKIFRVSSRRATQVPAIAFLISNLLEALPCRIPKIQFCQGGVREGYLFSSHLSPEIRGESPLVAATAPYAIHTPSIRHFTHLLQSSLPFSVTSNPTNLITPSLLTSLSSLLFVHTSHSKESASLSALHFPLTGPLSSLHGISHPTRAILSLMLYERWSGGGNSKDPDSLPPPYPAFKQSLEQILLDTTTTTTTTPNSNGDLVWWIRYIGRIAALIGSIYKSGKFLEDRIKLNASWISSGAAVGHEKEKDKVLRLQITVIQGETEASNVGGAVDKQELLELVKDVEKLGKKKKCWVNGVVGYKVAVDVTN
ncbi:putative retrograde regulation protein 2 [Phaeomoniella chlamydospora]|uniref:Putative retrograde regulation protein 2 n=1 Tax=Phaeomoniella chlamydospora TaxID=158046 RepID=A0A0G2EYS7_PHACM|nr:putative retrograde regulation protein 2 [Phaeomoniella chlamydospora]